MIDFTETVFPLGGMRAQLRADGLPAGMYYTITQWVDGKVTAKSRAHGNGSVRYYYHATYDEALDHATAWAMRKIAEAKREEYKQAKARRAANSAAIDQVVEAIREQMTARLVKTSH